MPSKLVTARRKNASFVETAVETHGATAAAAVEERLRPLVGEGEPEPKVLHMLTLLSRNLAEDRQALVAADEANLAELDDDPEVRRRRDAAAAEVYRLVSRLRASVNALYGPEASGERLGVDGETSQDPVVLYQQALRIVERFTAPDGDWPKGTLPGVDLDPGTSAGALQPAVEELGAALHEVNLERRLAETTLVGKAEAQERFDRTYLDASRIIEAIFRMAGMTPLADRVRPSRRRPIPDLGPPVEPTPPEPDEGDEGDGGSGDVDTAPEVPDTPPVTPPPVPSPDPAVTPPS